jgi:hypothetical protein
MDARRTAALEIGAMLLVHDPGDRSWIGGILEVVAHGESSGEMVAMVVAWDPAWLGYVRLVAETREVFQTRTVALYLTAAPEGAADESGRKRTARGNTGSRRGARGGAKGEYMAAGREGGPASE